MVLILCPRCGGTKVVEADREDVWIDDERSCPCVLTSDQQRQVTRRALRLLVRRSHRAMARLIRRSAGRPEFVPRIVRTP